MKAAILLSGGIDSTATSVLKDQITYKNKEGN